MSVAPPFERFTYQRELLTNLTLRELRGRYKRSTLGWLWSVINPAVMIAVYTVVFSFFLRVEPPVGDPSGLKSYAFYLMTGLLPFLFLSNGVSGAVGSLTGNEGLIKKVYFPRSVLPTSSTIAGLATFGIEMSVLASLLIVLGGNMVLWWIPVVFVVAFIQFFFVLGLGMLFSSVNAYFRDVQHFTGILMMVWMWSTPILYPETVFDEPDGSVKEFLGIEIPRIMSFNPLTHFVTAYRDLFYSLRFPSLSTWLAMLVSTAIVFAVGAAVFRRLEPKLAEEL